MMNSKNQSILGYLQTNGAIRSRDLLDHFKISRPTLSRWIKDAGNSIVVIGKTTSTAYAARNTTIAELPLYTINEAGKPLHPGTLIPLAQGQWFLRRALDWPALFKGDFKDGLYPGLPWFLADLRPSGFLGRAFAKSMSQLFGYDTNPENWTDAAVAHVLSLYGTNLQSNFIIGEQALSKVLNSNSATIHLSKRDYPELSAHALQSGQEFGSSAGGEQPKFTTIIERDGEPRHVIVKFSPPMNSPAGRRWADLLISEHIANQVLKSDGHLCAKTQIHKIRDRIYLESERFDRVDLGGRRGLVSLRAIDAAFIGQGSGSWIKCAQQLSSVGLVTPETIERIARLWCFGNLIANNDMHFGNLSFYLDNDFPLALAPCYDMLPMHFRPAPSGEVPKVDFTPHRPLPENETAWKQVQPLALKFWQLVATDKRISEEFKAIARNSLKALQQIKV